jgi:myo-inositol-1(or 4)-monophosphatase
MTATATPSPAELERWAVELAEGAAGLVRDGRTGAVRVAAKSTATDLVTQVDRASERWLVEHIGRLRPEDGIMGEEGGERHGSSRVRWVVDPIDGTVNFVLGLPQFAVSVAAGIDGRPVAGAVANPLTGETFHAHLGGGAYLAGERLSGPRRVELSRAVVSTGFGYDAALRARQVAVLAPLLPAVGDVRRLGAASLDLCFVAAGRVDAYFEAGLNHWDHAAGGLIATEAGCVVSGLRGLPPSGRCYAVAGADLAAEFFALLESVGADQVNS